MRLLGTVVEGSPDVQSGEVSNSTIHRIPATPAARPGITQTGQSRGDGFVRTFSPITLFNRGVVLAIALIGAVNTDIAVAQEQAADEASHAEIMTRMLG